MEVTALLHFLVFLHDLALFPGFYLYPVNDLV